MTAIVFLEPLDSTGWGNKARCLESSYLLSIILDRPLYISYPLYFNCFRPPANVYNIKALSFSHFESTGCFLVRSSSDVKHLLSMDVPPSVIVTGFGFGFVADIINSLNLPQQNANSYIRHIRSLFSSPTDNITMTLPFNAECLDPLVVFQYRCFVDSRFENVSRYPFFVDHLQRLIPNLFPCSCPINALFLSDDPVLAQSLFDAVSPHVTIRSCFVDKSFVHTGFASPLLRGSSLRSFFSEVSRRLIEFARKFFLIIKLSRLSLYPDWLRYSLLSYSPLICSRDKIRVVAVWYLVYTSTHVFSTFTSFVSSAVLGSNSCVFAFDQQSSRLTPLSFNEVVLHL